MDQALQTRCVGMKPDETGHPLAPMEIVYEVEEVAAPRRPHIPLGAKLVGIFIIVSWAYILIQGGINTFS